MFLCITKKFERKKPIIRQDNFEIIEQFPLTVQSGQLTSTGKRGRQTPLMTRAHNLTY